MAPGLLFKAWCLVLFWGVLGVGTGGRVQALRAQGLSRDTVSVMMYNMLYYGVNTTFCTGTNNSVFNKNTHLMTLLNHTAPDLLGVCEMGPNTTANLGFLTNVLNNGGRSGYIRANPMNPSGSDIISLLYYNSLKFGIERQQAIPTQGRDIAFYRLYHKPVPASGDTVWLQVAVAHLKAGGTAADVTQRGQEAGSLVQFLRQQNFRGNLLVMGDLNVSASTEPAFDSLSQGGTLPYHRLRDPVSRPGSWGGNSSFALWHTQSTRITSNGCISGGGLDDRYDHILVNDFVLGDSAGVRYLPASFRVLGNDGNRFNGNVNGTFNASVPVAVANALYEISDHLPVTLKLAVGAGRPTNLEDSGWEGNPARAFERLALVWEEVGTGIGRVLLPVMPHEGVWDWRLRSLDGRVLVFGTEPAWSHQDKFWQIPEETRGMTALEWEWRPLDPKLRGYRKVLTVPVHGLR